MREVNKEKSKIQCFNCRSVTKSSKWIKDINEDKPELLWSMMYI